METNGLSPDRHQERLGSVDDTGIESVAAALIRAELCPVPLRILEMAAIKNALRHTSGNRTRAAKSLGISVRTLQRKIKLWANADIANGVHERGRPKNS